MINLSTVEQASAWLRERVGQGALRTDSRQVRAGDGFIAWPGAATDGRQYVKAVLQVGVAACLVEAEGVQAYGFDHPNVASFKDLKEASGLIASAYFDQPSQDLDVIAVTGTNGKTSTTWWLAQSINTLQKKEQISQDSCGLMGTFGIGTLGQMRPTGLTTPDPVTIQSELARLRDVGATACAIEVSSIGLAEHRTAGMQTKVAVFTNFTQDHLDYHGSMQAYWSAKQMLFDADGLQAAVINLDDPKGEELAAYCAAKGLRVITTSMKRTDASLRGSEMAHQAQGLIFTIMEGSLSQVVRSPSLGEYNILNILGVVGALRALGVEFGHACSAVARCTAVPGRMESVEFPGQPLVVVDYAHTSDALEKALEALRPLTFAKGGKLWCVFGCGGNRDAGKRPLMAQAAQRAADRIIVTSDNPRLEDANEIAAQMMAGLEDASCEKWLLELDRAKAIALVIHEADPKDVILIAGKGHEDYQELAGVRYPFSDQKHALLALTQLSRGEKP
jgi:UDP-N-acetylmuramyl-tripeptide synthetase